MKRKLIALVTAFTAVASFINVPAIADATNLVSYGATSGQDSATTNKENANPIVPGESSEEDKEEDVEEDAEVKDEEEDAEEDAEVKDEEEDVEDEVKDEEEDAEVKDEEDDAEEEEVVVTTTAAPAGPSYTANPIYTAGPSTTAATTTAKNTDTTKAPEADVDADTDADTSDVIIEIDEEKYEVAETVTVDAADVEDEEKVLEVIAAAAEKATEDAKIAVVLDMKEVEEKVITEAVLEAVKGQDIVLVLEVEEGIEWKINGKDITETGDIDLTISKEVEDIPADMIKDFSDAAKHTVTLSIAHDGEFGFEAVLSVNVEEENAGAYANLYYYNTDTEEAEFQGAALIKEDGKVNFLFTHASEYIITVTDEPAEDEVAVEDEDNAALEDEDTSKTEEDVKEDKDEVTTEADGNPSTGVGFAASGVLFSIATLALLRKKKD